MNQLEEAEKLVLDTSFSRDLSIGGPAETRLYRNLLPSLFAKPKASPSFFLLNMDEEAVTEPWAEFTIFKGHRIFSSGKVGENYIQSTQLTLD